MKRQSRTKPKAITGGTSKKVRQQIKSANGIQRIGNSKWINHAKRYLKIRRQTNVDLRKIQFEQYFLRHFGSPLLRELYSSFFTLISWADVAYGEIENLMEKRLDFWIHQKNNFEKLPRLKKRLEMAKKELDRLEKRFLEELEAKGSRFKVTHDSIHGLANIAHAIRALEKACKKYD